jgi:acyl-CoA synthetase (AMP-forming)/AMP-acid ligase II
MANALLALGVEPGDRVGVLEDNSIGAADLLLGCTAANIARVPLYPRNKRESHVHMLGHTGCRVVVVAEHYAHELEGIQAEVPSLEHVVVRDGDYEASLSKQAALDPDPAVDEDDLYLIRHTAGTTGKSKGVAFTHRQWLATARDWFFAYPPIEIGDPCLHVGPISHGSGYFFSPIWICGGKNVLLPRFDPPETVETLECEGISFMFTVPTILAGIVREPTAPDRDWSKLKMICVGGSPITETTARRSIEVLGDAVYQVFGQTEAMPATHISPREWLSEVPGSDPLRSAGRAAPFVEVDILDTESHEVLGPDEEGEIAVRSDGMMTGFWENPEASAERLANGYVLTGDVGRIDRNGYLYILDRKDDMIISGGFNIYPAELENAIETHPDVLEVAVFAIPHERWGETPAAVVVVQAESTLTEGEVKDLCGEVLGSYKKPSLVVLRSEPLPKSPVGKILRKQLREPYWEGVERRVAGN